MSKGLNYSTFMCRFFVAGAAHFVNLRAQISWLCEPPCADFVAGAALCEPPCADFSWQAQHFVNLHVQISWQAQRCVNLHVQIWWQARFRGRHSICGAGNSSTRAFLRAVCCACCLPRGRMYALVSAGHRRSAGSICVLCLPRGRMHALALAGHRLGR